MLCRQTASSHAFWVLTCLKNSHGLSLTQAQGAWTCSLDYRGSPWRRRSFIVSASEKVSEVERPGTKPPCSRETLSTLFPTSPPRAPLPGAAAVTLLLHPHGRFSVPGFTLFLPPGIPFVQCSQEHLLILSQGSLGNATSSGKPSLIPRAQYELLFTGSLVCITVITGSSLSW